MAKCMIAAAADKVSDPSTVSAQENGSEA